MVGGGGGETDSQRRSEERQQAQHLLIHLSGFSSSSRRQMRPMDESATRGHSAPTQWTLLGKPVKYVKISLFKYWFN
jgi:hypothetical protein